MVGERLFSVFNGSVLEHVKRACLAYDVVDIFVLMSKARGKYAVFYCYNAADSAVDIVKQIVEVLAVEVVAVEVAGAEKMYAGITVSEIVEGICHCH